MRKGSASPLSEPVTVLNPKATFTRIRFHNESEHFHVRIHLSFTRRRMKMTVNAYGTENAYQSEDLRKRRPFEFM